MKSQTILFWVVLALLCWGSLQQRGGGGGGGRGGGGSRGGGGYYGGRTSTTSCRSRCALGDQACYKRCDSQTGGIVGGVIGGIAFVGGAIAICCCCMKKGEAGGESFQELETKFNVVETNLMVEEEFKAKRDEILYWFNNKGAEVPSNFAYVQAGVPTPVVVSTSIVEERSFLTKVALNGNDSVGAWTGTGYILCRKKPASSSAPAPYPSPYQTTFDTPELFFWFEKYYNDRQAAGQTGEWSQLIYESTAYFDGVSMQGRWYYSNFNNEDPNNEYAGRWLVMNGRNYPNFYSVPCQFITNPNPIAPNPNPIGGPMMTPGVGPVNGNPLENGGLGAAIGANFNNFANNTGINGNISNDTTAGWK